MPFTFTDYAYLLCNYVVLLQYTNIFQLACDLPVPSLPALPINLSPPLPPSIIHPHFFHYCNDDDELEMTLSLENNSLQPLQQ